jgi:hypothetical protein
MHHSRDLRRERWGVKHEPRDGGFGLATASAACPALLVERWVWVALDRDYSTSNKPSQLT